MLAGAVRGLARRGWQVTLVARGIDRLERVAARAPTGTVHPRVLDYRDTEGLRRLVASAAAERGPIRLVLAWIHDTAPDAHSSIAEEVGASPPRCCYLEVLGSATVDPSTLGRERARRLAALPHLQHRRILLGHGDGGRRWLTDQEISAGVLDAVDNGTTSDVIGTLAPFRTRDHYGQGSPSSRGNTVAIDPWIYVERTGIEVEDVDPQAPELLRVRVDLNRVPEPEWTASFEASTGLAMPASMQRPRVVDDTILMRTPDAAVEEYVEHLDRRITAANEHYVTQVLPLRRAEQEERDRQAVERQRRLEDAQRRIDAAQRRIDEAQRRIDAL